MLHGLHLKAISTFLFLFSYLDRGDELAVQVEVDVGEVGRGSAVDDDLVEDQLVCAGVQLNTSHLQGID